MEVCFDSNPGNLTPEPVLFNCAILRWAENRATGRTVQSWLRDRLKDENREGVWSETLPQGELCVCSTPRSKAGRTWLPRPGAFRSEGWLPVWVMVRQACFPSSSLPANISTFFKIQNTVSSRGSFLFLSGRVSSLWAIGAVYMDVTIIGCKPIIFYFFILGSTLFPPPRATFGSLKSRTVLLLLLFVSWAKYSIIYLVSIELICLLNE